jgi:hypothetical protein
MKPSTIVFGKMISGVIFTLLLMSITTPFMTLAYLLRGIDLEIMLADLLFTFIGIQLLNSFAILIASSNRLWFSTYISVFIILAASAVVFYPSWFIMIELIYEVCIYGMSFCFWGFLEFIFISIFIGGSIAMFSPPASNRIFPFRVLLTSVFAIAIIFAFLNLFDNSLWSFTDNILIVESISMVILPFLILLTACERVQWSTRIRRSLPKSLLGRILLFPFYTGAACGIVWIVLILSSILLMDLLLLDANRAESKPFYWNRGINFLLGWVIFAFNYGMTAMLIRDSYLKKFDSRWTIIVTLILLVVFSLGSMLFYLILMIIINPSNGIMPDILHGYSASLFSAINPFCNFGDNYYDEIRAVGMFLWFAILCGFLTRWFYKQIKNFNPNVEDSIITYEEAIESVKNIDNN